VIAVPRKIILSRSGKPVSGGKHDLGRLVHRQRLAGESRFVDRQIVSGGQPRIGRDEHTALDQQKIAGDELDRVHQPALSGADDRHRLQRIVREPEDRMLGLSFGRRGDPGIEQHDRGDDRGIRDSAGEKREGGRGAQQRDRQAGHLLDEDSDAGTRFRPAKLVAAENHQALSDLLSREPVREPGPQPVGRVGQGQGVPRAWCNRTVQGDGGRKRVRRPWPSFGMRRTPGHDIIEARSGMVAGGPYSTSTDPVNALARTEITPRHSASAASTARTRSVWATRPGWRKRTRPATRSCITCKLATSEPFPRCITDFLI
jgi:hypothetical protein